MLTITKNSGYVCVSNGTDFILLNDAVTDKIAYVMREFAAGKLKDSHGNIVTDKSRL